MEEASTSSPRKPLRSTRWSRQQTARARKPGVLGAAIRGYRGSVLGISIESTAVELQACVTKLAVDASKLANANVTAVDLRVEVNANYVGDGYAVVGDLERDAIRTVARTQGLLLDPVYTGRAMGGLIDLIQQGKFTSGDKILFWHTGGTAALSAFAEKLWSRKI
jgi:D-cysteine desulfhydrase